MNTPEMNMPNKLPNKRLIAIVPMRHHSERVPGKNYRSCAGQPLYRWVVQALLGCSIIDQVVIDTDSLIILADASKHFPQVRLLERPETLRDGNIPMNDVLLNTVRQLEDDDSVTNYYLQTHATNPLLSTATITQAVQLFMRHYPIYDSLFSVSRLQTRLWDGLTRAINHNPAILARTQDLPPVFEENSCLYLFTKYTLEEHHHRIGKRPLMFTMDAREAVDIDEELDFQIAEFLLTKKITNPDPVKKNKFAAKTSKNGATKT